MSSKQAIKKYLYSLRFYILFSLCVFIGAIFLGWVAAKILPEESQEIMEQLQKTLEPISKISPFGQCFYIFLNNTTSAIFTILLGVFFGVFPFLSVFSNGEVIGMLAFLLSDTISPLRFLAGILPWNFEIPVLIMAGAMGMKIGRLMIEKSFQKNIDIKKNYHNHLIFL